eukprot:12109395-Prorocentrum_lima.AAC.1
MPATAKAIPPKLLTPQAKKQPAQGQAQEKGQEVQAEGANAMEWETFAEDGEDVYMKRPYLGPGKPPGMPDFGKGYGKSSSASGSH